jgi:hypothetical protein
LGKAVPRATTREPGDLPLSASSAVERVGSMVRPDWAVTLSLFFRMDRPVPVRSIDGQMTSYVTVSTVLLLALAATLPHAHGQGNELHIELNRLEEHGDGCRVHLVLENASPRAYTSYQLDLVVFAADGVIARRLALETAPLRANKTMVKEFELTGLSCERVGRILLNDVPACSSDAGNMDDCVTATRVSSRASVAFVK